MPEDTATSSITLRITRPRFEIGHDRYAVKPESVI